jgi:hypothetical protein
VGKPRSFEPTLARRRDICHRVGRGRSDQSGKPVAGITLSTHWIVQEDQPPRAFEGVSKTDDQGRFQLELTSAR